MANMEQPAFQAESSVRALEGIIFDLLLTSDGRTTDLLETLMDEKMQVSVLRQGAGTEVEHAEEHAKEQGEEHAGDQSPMEASSFGGHRRDIARESILIGATSRIVVSHNIALIHAEHVPHALLERIARGHEGIGKAISSIGAESLRKIADYGMIGSDAALDLNGHPVKLQFAERCDSVYYKKYVIYFGLLPGIQLLEYFNPHIVKHRLSSAINKR